MKGKFIVIEGIDGCGKTTQIDELSKWLPNSGLIKKGSKLITTREPGGSLLGKKLRGLILDNNENYKPSSLAELLLYSADRAEHVSKIISPAINNKVAMIGDGINDVPALASSDLGIAVGSGTQIAKANADVVLMGDQLTGLPYALNLAKKNHKKNKAKSNMGFWLQLTGYTFSRRHFIP